MLQSPAGQRVSRQHVVHAGGVVAPQPPGPVARHPVQHVAVGHRDQLVPGADGVPLAFGDRRAGQHVVHAGGVVAPQPPAPVARHPVQHVAVRHRDQLVDEVDRRPVTLREGRARQDIVAVPELHLAFGRRVVDDHRVLAAVGDFVDRAPAQRRRRAVRVGDRDRPHPRVGRAGIVRRAADRVALERLHAVQQLVDREDRQLAVGDPDELARPQRAQRPAQRRRRASSARPACHRR